MIDIIYDLGFDDIDQEQYELILDALNYLAAIKFISIDDSTDINPNEWLLSRNVELDLVYTNKVGITKELIKNATLNNIKMKYHKKGHTGTGKKKKKLVTDIQ